MTKKLPTYTSSTKVQPAAQPYSKGFNEWSNDFAHITKQINSVRTQDVDFDTIQQAKEDGANPNFQEKEPVTREDRIYERQALESNQIALSNQVRSHALELRDQLTQPGTLNANSGVQFHAQMDEYLAGVVNAAPAGNKEYIKNMGQRYTDSIGEGINLRAETLAKSNLRFNLYQFIDGNMQTAQRDALEGSAKGAIDAAGLYGQIADKVKSAVASGYLPGVQGASLLARTQQQLQVTSVLGKFRNDMNNGNAEESLLEFMQNPPPDMAPAQYKQSLAMMQGMIQTKMNADKLNNQMITQQTLSIFDQVASGNLDPNSADVSEAYQNAQSLGDSQRDAFNQGLQNATVKGALKKSTEFITPAQADQTADMLIQKLDPNSPNYQTQLDAIAEAKMAVYKNWKVFASDPAGYVMNSPMVQQAIEASRTQPQVPFKSGGIDANNQFLNTDINKAIIAQELQMGAQENPVSKDIPQLSLISKPVAKNLAAALNSMPIEDQMGRLQMLQKKEPEYFSVLMRDLSNAGYTLSNQYLFAVSQTNPSKQFDVINSLRMTDKEMKTLTPKQRQSIQKNVTSNLADYNNSLNNYALPSPDLIMQSNDFVNRLATYYMYSGKAGDASTAAKMAYNALIPNIWNFDNPDGRSPIRFPKSLSASQIKLATSYVMKHDISPTSTFYYQGQPMKNSASYYQGVTENGRWINLPDNSGIILADQSGTPVQHMVKGKLKFVGFKFRALENQNSKINQKISNDLMQIDQAYKSIAKHY